MSNPSTPVAPAPVEWNWNQRIAKWVPILATAVAAVVGVQKFTDNYRLPSCDSTRSLEAIRSIFREKDIAEPTLTGAKGVASTSAERTCTTAYEIPNETGTLEYRVFWEGWDPKVMITKVN